MSKTLSVRGASRIFALRCITGLASLAAASAAAGAGSVGWGVDGVLSRHVKPSELPAYLELLERADIILLRERLPSILAEDPQRIVDEALHRLDEAGLQLMLFAQEPTRPHPTTWGPFEPDLVAVHTEGVSLAEKHAKLEAMWELHNEPDLGWWPDMPDRYSAHAAALYLGLKKGDRSAPVLLGSLGLPPGPWLERAASSGLLGYADAWNAHYYGEPAQFTGFLVANEQAMAELARGAYATRPYSRWPSKGRSVLSKQREGGVWHAQQPIWITECGLSAVTPGTWADPERRRLQAEFTVSTAAQALARPTVAAFMPFVLVHRNDPYALTETADQPWPAWTEYARFTRENPWPERPALRPPERANPVVLQWLADAATATGHKVAGTYRWLSDEQPIRGTLAVYNFGKITVRGRIYGQTSTEPGWDELRGGIPWRLPVPLRSRPSQAVSGPITIEPGGKAEIPIEFPFGKKPVAGHREWRQFWFEEASGRRALVGFGLEQAPGDSRLAIEPLRTADWGHSTPGWGLVPNRIAGEGRGRWQAINGVRVLTDRRDGLARFEITRDPNDPIYPPMAALRLDGGLAGYTHLRVSQRRLLEAVNVRVDLVDKDGRRFTIWENLGRTRGAGADEPVWMALADFHPYAWGLLDGQRRLKLDEIRELQLRFYAPRSPAMADVEVQLARPLSIERYP